MDEETTTPEPLPHILAEHRYDSRSIEAQFHKRITFLGKRDQGYVMSAFREVFKQAVQPAQENEP